MLCNAGWLQETAPGAHLPALPHPKSQTSIIRRNIKPPDTTWQSLICSTQASHMFPLKLTAQLHMKPFMVKAFVFSHVGLQLSYTYICIYFVFCEHPDNAQRTETHDKTWIPRNDANWEKEKQMELHRRRACRVLLHDNRSMQKCTAIRGAWLDRYFF